ncbi:dockerin type I domain-containing protein [Planctomycetota bacterium]
MEIQRDTIDLTGLRLAEAVALDLSGVQLSPGEYAVVVEDTAAFAHRYGNEIRVIGQWNGRLSNAGDRVTVENAAGNRMIDIPYRDGAPWPAADGNGKSLTRTSPVAFGSSAGSWSAVVPSPGRAEYAADLNGDNRVDARDIDLVAAAIRNQDLAFDLNEDDTANNSSWETGDWNGDGEFDTSDFVFAFQTGMYING